MQVMTKSCYRGWSGATRRLPSTRSVPCVALDQGPWMLSAAQEALDCSSGGHGCYWVKPTPRRLAHKLWRSPSPIRCHCGHCQEPMYCPGCNQHQRVQPSHYRALGCGETLCPPIGSTMISVKPLVLGYSFTGFKLVLRQFSLKTMTMRSIYEHVIAVRYVWQTNNSFRYATAKHELLAYTRDI